MITAKVGRRGFLRALGIGGAAVALGRGLMGCQGPSRSEQMSSSSQYHNKYDIHFEAKVASYDLAKNMIYFKPIKILSAYDRDTTKKIDDAKAFEILRQAYSFKANEAMLAEVQNNQDVRNGERSIMLVFSISTGGNSQYINPSDVSVESFKIYNNDLDNLSPRAANDPGPIVESPEASDVERIVIPQ